MNNQEIYNDAVRSIKAGESINSIARRHGKYRATISNWLKNKGPKIHARDHSAATKSEAVRLYLEGMATAPIAKLLGCTDRTVSRWVLEAGIPTRGYSESAALVRERGGGQTKGIRRPYFSARQNKWLIPDSSYEYARMMQLEDDVNVAAFEKCSRSLFYADGKKRYLPDMYVVYINGEKFIEEIKPKNLVNDVKVIEKANSAREWCADNGCEFRFITELDIGAGYLKAALSDNVPEMILLGSRKRLAEYRHWHYMERVKNNPQKLEEHRARARDYYHRKMESENAITH